MFAVLRSASLCTYSRLPIPSVVCVRIEQCRARDLPFRGSSPACDQRPQTECLYTPLRRREHDVCRSSDKEQIIIM